MEKQKSYDRPNLVTMHREMGASVYTIVFDVEQNASDAMYEYNVETLKAGILEYGAIVNAIITAYYPQDKMQAVINNYLLDPQDSEAVAEFQTMQQKRAWAKQTAKELMAYAEENGIIEHFDEE